MTEQRNLMLAIVLSVLIILGFQIFYENPRIQRLEAERQAAAQQSRQESVELGEGVAPSLDGAALSAAGAMSVEAALDDEGARLTIGNDRAHGSIALKGGRIDDWTLIDYRETVDPESAEIRLLGPVGGPEPYFAQFGWAPARAGETPALPGPDSLWTADRDTIAPGQPATLRWDNGEGLIFERRISIDENYLIGVERRVINQSREPVAIAPYALLSRWGTPTTSGIYILHEGPIGVLGDTLQEIDYDDLQSQPEKFESKGGWLGITDKYWLASLLPDQDANFSATFRHEQAGDKYQVDYVGTAVAIEPGDDYSFTERLFLGAKEVDLLDAYSEEHGYPLFDRAVDFGWFYFLTKPFFYILTFFFGVFGNYGVAILLLTLLVKLVFFPLANKSYVSMSKMKLLQPEMEKIKERCGDDRQKMSQEMMELYKREKVNPMSGCLPILVQIPVFFALYKVLYVSIEMRHAPFFGWIEDLSAPDPTSIFNLFGLLPWDAPAFLALGIWPLLMGVTMFAQTKLNPAPTDPVQAKVLLFLPVIFTVLMAGFPAGLVIYWTWNNLLSIAQQWLIMNKVNKEAR